MRRRVPRVESSNQSTRPSTGERTQLTRKAWSRTSSTFTIGEALSRCWTTKYDTLQEIEVELAMNQISGDDVLALLQEDAPVGSFAGVLKYLPHREVRRRRRKFSSARAANRTRRLCAATVHWVLLQRGVSTAMAFGRWQLFPARDACAMEGQQASLVETPSWLSQRAKGRHKLRIRTKLTLELHLHNFSELTSVQLFSTLTPL